MTIQLVHDDFVTALAQVRRVADDLRHHQRAAERPMEALLDDGWAGTAARGYLEGWHRWQAGCAEVLAGLDAMADLLAEARAVLVTQDAAVATTFGGPS